MATTTLSDKARALVERPIIANVATVDAAGHPQLTPVWIDLEGDEVVFNTARGRAKDRNLSRDPHVARSRSSTPTIPTTCWSCEARPEPPRTGPTPTSTHWPRNTWDVDTYPMRQPGEVRVKYRVHPDAVVMQAEG